MMNTTIKEEQEINPLMDDTDFCQHLKDTGQRHIDKMYQELGQSSRGAILWDSLTHEERSFFCVVAKVGKKTDIIETAKKKLCELNDLERIKIFKKIQGLSRLTAPFSSLSRYEFK